MKRKREIPFEEVLEDKVRQDQARLEESLRLAEQEELAKSIQDWLRSRAGMEFFSLTARMKRDCMRRILTETISADSLRFTQGYLAALEDLEKSLCAKGGQRNEWSLVRED